MKLHICQIKKKNQAKQNPPNPNKTNTERAGYRILCALHLETLQLLQNTKLLLHSSMIY